MQILPCLVPRSTILIILPLLSLGFEQEEKIPRLGHAVRPIFVHGDNANSPNLLRDVKEGSIPTHILFSLELFTGRWFRYIIRNPMFRSLVKWRVIDEAQQIVRSLRRNAPYPR